MKIRVISEFELDTSENGLPAEISKEIISAVIRRNTLHGWYCFLRESEIPLETLIQEHKGLKNLICGFAENVKAEIMDS